MSLRRTVAPVLEPITLADACACARLDPPASPLTDQQKYVQSLIKLAREHVEDILQRSLCLQTWVLKLDGFPGGATLDRLMLRQPLWSATDPVIYLKKPPVLAVDSITYVDTSGQVQTLATDQYVVDLDSEPGRIVPAYSVIWPVTYPQPNTVMVTYKTGYASTAASPATADDVPERAKQAMRLVIGDFYENREDHGVQQLFENPAVINLLAPLQVRNLD